MNPKTKSTLLSIPFSILWLLLFYSIFVAVGVLLMFIFRFLHKLPVIGTIVNTIFYLRGDSPYSVSLIISAVVAYLIVIAVSGAALKSGRTKGLSVFCAGIYIATLNVIFFIINLLFKGAIIANIIAIVASVPLIAVGRCSLKDSKISEY